MVSPEPARSPSCSEERLSCRLPRGPRQTDTLIVRRDGVREAGDYVVRLRVDGVDSIPIDLSGTTPKFASRSEGDDAHDARRGGAGSEATTPTSAAALAWLRLRLERLARTAGQRRSLPLSAAIAVRTLPAVVQRAPPAASLQLSPAARRPRLAAVLRSVTEQQIADAAEAMAAAEADRSAAGA